MRFDEHPGELANIMLSGLAIGFQAAGQGLDLAAGTAYKFPDEIWGYAGMGGPLLFVFGGAHEGASLQSWARVMYGLSTLTNSAANLSGLIAGYQRRDEEWDFQVASAGKELAQMEQQIIGGEIRQQIATRDLANHEQQIEQAEETEAFLKDKFTNQQLYSWMVGQVSGLYFQAYQMAYDLAKQAEKAFRHELGLEDADTNFIQFGYWDSLKKGLLAGDKLHHDLRRMEVAYLEKNKREYELTKHISLALLNPEVLLQLRETGSCDFNIPEIVFDIDHPGQYMRRIKSVSLTIPCVTGPYTSVSAKLTLLGNRFRRKITGTSEKDYPYAFEGENGFDPRFTHNVIGIQSIATSHAQGDSGLFELNFRDERYLPFEGAGAISSWRLELPTEFRQFDYNTISDVIIHINYTARDGGDGFKGTVNNFIREGINNWLKENEETGLLRLFSLKDEFPKEWNDLTHKPEDDCEIVLTHRHFPFFVRERELKPHAVSLYFEPASGASLDDLPQGQLNDTLFSDVQETNLGAMKGLVFEGITGSIIPFDKESSLKLDLTVTGIEPKGIVNIYMLMHYKV